LNFVNTTMNNGDLKNLSDIVHGNQKTQQFFGSRVQCRVVICAGNR
jgi:hypothetical protein